MPLLAAQRYFPGVAGQLPPGKGSPWGGAPLAGRPHLGQEDRLVVGGTHGRVVGQVLLQQPGGQFAA